MFIDRVMREPFVETVEETGSTNADLLSRIGSGERIVEGFWLRAERQVGGRGRLGRRWESPIGNLYCSTVINLRGDDPAPHTLSFVAGLACFDSLKRSLLPGAPITLKWPNDAQIGGAKVAGILLERIGQSVVVGIGINVSHAPDIARGETTSIVLENDKHGGDPRLVLSILSKCFANRVDRWRNEPLTSTLDDWISFAHPIGSALAVGDKDERVTGSFGGLDDEGALLLRLANGAMRTIHAGDVSMIAKKEV
ncbi:MAG: biotin--[acetyl-CoA-carboxylase] ligase [Pseudomonadota bacterium]